MSTRTGSFPIGFRRGWGVWQKETQTLARWATSQGFEALDLITITAQDAAILRAEGLRLGSVDLLDMGKITSSDTAVRKDVASRNLAYIKEATALGAKVFFTIIAGDASRKRAENYAIAVEAFGPIATAAAQAGAKIAIEGWPGGAGVPNLCCNPETYRSFIKDVNPASIAINYDPSHLIRMGIDPIRFLNEFAPHIQHVHGKDTEILAEAVYELGLYQESAFGKGHGYGAHAWRYAIPGHGMMRWTEALRILQVHQYAGVVSIELEDENFNGTEAGEKAGLIHALEFLRSA